MRILLAIRKGLLFTFKSGLEQRQQPNCRILGEKLFCRYELFETNFEGAQKSDKDNLDLLSKVRSQMNEYCAAKHPSGSMPHRLFWAANVHIGVSDVLSQDGSHLKGYLKVQGLLHYGCLQALWELFGTELEMQASIGLHDIGSKFLSRRKLSTAGMKISSESGMAECQDMRIEFPVTHFANWKNSNGIRAEVKVIAAIEDSVLSKANTPSNIMSTVVTVNRSILENEIFSDATLITSDGVQIRAHRIFLASHSPIFQTMFQADRKDSRESIVEMSDMGEMSVRSLLTYLYYSEIQLEDMECSTLLELYHASYKYQISSLQPIMRRLVLSAPIHWFDAETGVKLFMIAIKGVPYDEEIKIKAIQIIKMLKSNSKDFPVLQELLKNDSEAALDLLKYALAT